MLDNLILGAIRGVVETVVKEGNNNAPPSEAKVIAAQAVEVAKEHPKVKEVLETVVNASNSEPWYRSRIYWGLLVSAFFGLSKPFIDLGVDDASQAAIVGALSDLGTLAGIAYAAYGRAVGASKPPLGK